MQVAGLADEQRTELAHRWGSAAGCAVSAQQQQQPAASSLDDSDNDAAAPPTWRLTCAARCGFPCRPSVHSDVKCSEGRH